MFTGIIEELGEVMSLKKSAVSCTLTIKAKQIMSDLKIGDSVAVNGVCLTASRIDKGSFIADVMNETLRASSLGALVRGSEVNLERAMPAQGRFGGHIVSGHIDSTGVISKVKADCNAVWYTITAPQSVMRYIVKKGSIAIDGISLTVARVDDNSFSVSMIPHTAKATALGKKQAGDIVNLENDIIAKYIERLLAPQENSPKSSITMSFLAENGF